MGAINQAPLACGLNTEGSDGSFAMGSMAAALPPYRHSAQSHGMGHSMQRLATGASPNLALPPQQMPQFAGQIGLISPGHNVNTQSPYPNSYLHGQSGSFPSPSYFLQHPNPAHRGGFGSPVQPPFPSQNFYPGQQQSPSHPYMYFPQGYGQLSPTHPGSQGRFGVFPYQQRRLNQFFYQGPHRLPETARGGLGSHFLQVTGQSERNAPTNVLGGQQPQSGPAAGKHAAKYKPGSKSFPS